MTLLVVNNGEIQNLAYFVNKNGNTEDLVYRLFTNNITPAETDVLGTYTEAVGGGYAAKTMTGSNWTLTPGNPSTAVYARQDWVFSGSLTGNLNLYGYFVTRAASLDLLFAERAVNIATPDAGAEYRVVPRVTAE